MRGIGSCPRPIRSRPKQPISLENLSRATVETLLATFQMPRPVNPTPLHRTPTWDRITNGEDDPLASKDAFDLNGQITLGGQKVIRNLWKELDYPDRLMVDIGKLLLSEAKNSFKNQSFGGVSWPA